MDATAKIMMAELVTGMHRLATRIATMPPDQRGSAYELARRNFAEPAEIVSRRTGKAPEYWHLWAESQMHAIQNLVGMIDQADGSTSGRA
jgi:hypothetical protein